MTELAMLEAMTAKAYRAMVNGSQADAKPPEGRKYRAWATAYDAVQAYGEEHGLLGLKPLWRSRAMQKANGERCDAV